MIHPPSLKLGDPAMAPMAFVAFVSGHPEQLAMPPGEPVVLTPQLRATMMKINGRVNQGIAYRAPSDDPMEPWCVLSTDIKPRASGSCHDIAVTKRELLLKAGFAPSQVLLAEVIPPESPSQHHLIVVVRTRQGDLVLDNLTPGQAPFWWVRNYKWLRVQSPYAAGAWCEVVEPDEA